MMIDNFKVEDVGGVYFIPTHTEPFEFIGKVFYPQLNKEGKYRFHIALFEDALVAKIRGGVLSVENSLHKFYHNNNINDFTYSEIKSAIEKVEDLFKVTSKQLKFKRLETAINTAYTIQPYTLFQLYKMNEFERMRNGKIVYGSKCFMTEYNLKSYNKHLEFKLNPNSQPDILGNKKIVPLNLNKFEVEYKKMRPLKGVANTLYDLKNKRVIQRLGNKLIKCFDDITLKKDYDYSNLTPRQRELIFAGMNLEFWEIEKLNMNTRKKKRTEYRKLVKLLDSNLIIDHQKEIRNLMLEKVNYLVSN